MKKVILLLVVLSFGSISAQSAFDFLNLNESPRAAAMAESFVSNNDDPNVIFFNPAGVGLLEGSPASFSFLNHIVGDINSASLSYSREIESLGRFAGSVKYVNYGTFPRADEYGNRNGDFGANDIAVGLAYSGLFDENFYYGATVKFIYSGIEAYSSTALAADLGLFYTFPDQRWNFGFSVLNLGSQLTQYAGIEENLPLDIRVGVSKSLLHLPFTFYFSLNRLNEKTDNFSDKFQYFTFGGEFRLSKVIRLRFGYDNEKRKELKIGTTAGLSGINFGIGVNVSSYKVDYSYSSMGSIGGLHRFGLTTEI